MEKLKYAGLCAAGIAVLGLILPLLAISMELSVGLSIYFCSLSILPVTIISGISTLCFNHFFVAQEPASPYTEEKSPIIEADYPETK